ncbi:hypothetical protein ACFLRQ_03465 [Bacteroidota bacterium]
MQNRSLAILIILILSVQVYGQIITVHSEFSVDSIMIGKHANYKIRIESAPDVFVRFPEYSDTITREIEIVKSTIIDTTYIDDKRILSQEYKVTSFEPGWNTVPPQPVSFETKDFSDTVYTTALLLTVLAPAIDTAQAIKPIKPPINTPVSLREVLPWILIGISAGLLIFLAIVLYRRYVKKKENPEYFTKKPLEPAHIVAFRELDILKNEKLPQKGRVKEYYVRLTEVIRVYITRQFDIYAMESTTSEILDAFCHHHNADEKLQDLLENLLMLADLVKFAKEDPLMEENERHLANAYFFIENTYRLFELHDDEIDEKEHTEEEEEKLESLKEGENG